MSSRGVAMVGIALFLVIQSVIAFESSEDIKVQVEKSESYFDEESRQEIQFALENWDNKEIRNQSLAFAINHNEDLISLNDIEGINKKLLLDYALERYPQIAAKLHSGYILSLLKTSIELTQKLESEKLDTLGTINRKISFQYQNQLTAADDQAHLALENLIKHFNASPISSISQFNRTRNSFLLAYHYFLEAKIKRLPSVTQWANEIKQLSQIAANPEEGSFKASDLKQRWKSIWDLEQSVEVRRAWVNRETITATTLAALAAVQAFCVVSTAGICAAAVPASASWSVRGARIALSSTQAVVISSSVIDIIDRYRFNGVSGLMNVATGIDVLLIISCLPAPSLKMLESTKTVSFLGKTISISDISLTLARLNIKASRSLFALGVSYGTWQIISADKIASRLTKESGYEVSPDEIKRQGAVHIMMGLLGGLQAYRYQKSQLDNSTNYRQYMSKQPGFIQNQIDGLKPFHPKSSLGNIYSGIKAMPQNLWLGTKTSLKGFGYLGYQVLGSGAMGLLAYSYPDFIMRKNSRPLPDLKPHESALLLNGFASNDMLYYAFSSSYANRHEIQKYQDKLGGEFFSSAPDFFLKIKSHAQKYGPIKYLKIMAHGVPGRIIPIATQDVMDGSSREIIDAQYIQENIQAIQTIARESIAPDAHIVIISCLVGGNLDKDTEYKGVRFEQKSGDNFIRALGNALLVQSGSIDSSRRVIMGLDGTLSPLFNHSLLSGQNTPENQLAFEAELKTLILREQTTYNSYLNRMKGMPLFEDQESADFQLLGAGLTKRLIAMYSQIWSLVYKFGINLEGGFFSDRHRYDEFVDGNLILSKTNE